MRYVVIVPTYNEAENVPILIERLKALDPAPDVVFVDDGSPDGTSARVKALAGAVEGLHVIDRTGKRGYALATLDGLRWALDRSYDYVCTMDADLSHDTETLPQLLRAAMDGADVSIGSRYMPGGGMQVDWGLGRRLTSTLGNVYIRVMLGTRVKDNTNGFRCYRQTALRAVPLDKVLSEGYSFLPEMLFYLRRAGMRIVEIPTVYVQRTLGESKLSRKVIFESIGRVTLLGLSRFLARTPA